MAPFARITAVLAFLLVGGNLALAVPHLATRADSEICGAGLKTGNSSLESGKSQSFLSHKEIVAPDACVQALSISLRNHVIFSATETVASSFLSGSLSIRGPPGS